MPPETRQKVLSSRPRPSQPTIPLVDLRRQFQTIRPEILAAIEHVCASGDFVLGSELERFEREFAATTGVRHAVGIGSGTGALLLALMACGVGEGDEVIVPANTFISTVLAVTHSGARPVLVDIDHATHLIDPAQVASHISRRTRAIIPVHLFGQTADMDAILTLARRARSAHGRRVWVVEDACQAHGAAYRGRPAGSLGDAAAFSFYPAKNLGAFGEGGAITTNSAALTARVRELRNIGQRVKNVHRVIGFNERLDTLQAAVLRVKLARLERWNRARRRAARLYTRLLQESPVSPPAEVDGNRHVFHLYVIRAPRRAPLAAHLRERGIATGVHYPVPVHLQPCYRHLALPRGSFPRAEKAAHEVLSLPIFPEITPAEVRRVCDAVRDFYGSAG